MIGDVGRGPYVAPEVAEFFRDRALAAATIFTPNAFELEWLTGRSVATLAEARAAVAALRARGPEVVAVTSLVLEDTPPDALDVLAGDETGLWRARTPKLPIAVNGAGDLFAALFFHHWLDGGSTPAALSGAVRRCSGSSRRRLRRAGGNSRWSTPRRNSRAPRRSFLPSRSDPPAFTFLAHRRTTVASI